MEPSLQPHSMADFDPRPMVVLSAEQFLHASVGFRSFGVWAVGCAFSMGSGYCLWDDICCVYIYIYIMYLCMYLKI